MILFRHTSHHHRIDLPNMPGTNEIYSELFSSIAVKLLQQQKHGTICVSRVNKEFGEKGVNTLIIAARIVERYTYRRNGIDLSSPEGLEATAILMIVRCLMSTNVRFV